MEPKGINRDDGKRPDGVTITSLYRGRSILRDTLATSSISSASREICFVANQSERSHYIKLKENYEFTPLSFETLGCMGKETSSFIDILGKHLATKTVGDHRPNFYYNVYQ